MDTGPDISLEDIENMYTVEMNTALSGYDSSPEYYVSHNTTLTTQEAPIVPYLPDIHMDAMLIDLEEFERAIESTQPRRADDPKMDRWYEDEILTQALENSPALMQAGEQLLRSAFIDLQIQEQEALKRQAERREAKPREEERKRQEEEEAQRREEARKKEEAQQAAFLEYFRRKERETANSQQQALLQSQSYTPAVPQSALPVSPQAQTVEGLRMAVLQATTDSERIEAMRALKRHIDMNTALTQQKLEQEQRVLAEKAVGYYRTPLIDDLESSFS